MEEPVYNATGLTGWQREAVGPPSAYTPVPHCLVAHPYAIPAAQVTPKQEVGALKNQIKFMEESIKTAQERISELEENEK